MDCKCCENNLVDYIEGNLKEDKAIEMAEHLASNPDCQETYRSIQAMLSTVDAKASYKIPDGFIYEVRRNVAQTKPRRSLIHYYKPVTWIAAIMLSLVFVSTAVATDGFSSLLDFWKQMTEEQQDQVEKNIANGLGEELNLSVTDENVKVTITQIVADDLQTHIYYETEDLNKESYYTINYSNGTDVTNQEEYWADLDYSVIHSHLRLFSDQEYVVKGRIGLRSFDVEEGNINLLLSSLEKVSPLFEETVDQQLVVEDPETIKGDWSFELPVEKHPAIVKEMNVETEIDGYPITFTEITFAPTVTVLSYNSQDTKNDDKMLNIFNLKQLKANGEIYEIDNMVAGHGTAGDGQSESEVSFESMYLEVPDEIEVHISNYTEEVKDDKTIAIDFEDPQQFEYQGSTISFEEILLGNPTTFTIHQELSEDRKFEQMSYDFTYDEDFFSLGTSSSLNGVFIDTKGDQYDLQDYFFRTNELIQPRIFITESAVTISSDEEDVDVIKPSGMVINGYSQTTFVDKKIMLRLDEE